VGPVLVLLCFALAYLYESEARKIADRRAFGLLRYNLLPAEQVTDENRDEQIRRLHWNQLASRVDSLYVYQQREAFVSRYSEHSFLFWVTLIGGVLTIIGDFEGFRRRK
jgi:hypothetical protein